jgi:hypothetical protein
VKKESNTSYKIFKALVSMFLNPAFKRRLANTFFIENSTRSFDISILDELLKLSP